MSGWSGRGTEWSGGNWRGGGRGMGGGGGGGGMEVHWVGCFRIGRSLCVYSLLPLFASLCWFVVSSCRHFPETSDLLATLGLLYLEAGQPKKAFQFLGNSLTYDPCNTKVQQTEGGRVLATACTVLPSLTHILATTHANVAPQVELTRFHILSCSCIW